MKNWLSFGALKSCIMEVIFVLKDSAASSVQMDNGGGRKTFEFFFSVSGKMHLV